MAAPTYLDSNVISYLTAWPSRDIVSLAHQQLTREWWDRQRHGFELHVSELVLFEIGRGDASAAQARLEFVRGLPILRITPEARGLADRIFRATTLPDKAAADALHIALAAVNGMDFLLTWNCTHIANGVILKTVNAVCRDHGYEPPIVCTPEELLAP
ncbi:MAG TPA: type II toxin-antitoxin system VapC family toxin [Thermoanaerobaculia bacterium]|nr:type II toxin-antitoxin system VapC family toxin [Thermoanaerobaculia bacterium]